ncbi:MAG: ABC transporter permease [Candidatus Bathyarchaeia archaeon]
MKKNKKISKPHSFYLFIAISFVSLIFLLIIPEFRNIKTTLFMLKYTGTIGLCALGQTFIMLAGGGGIDLSTGSVLSLSGVLLYFFSRQLNVWVSGVCCLIIGGILGAINGVLVTYAGIPPFIATLGTMFLFSGVALGLTRGTAYAGFPQEFGVLGNGLILGYIPVQLLIFLLIFLILFLVQRATRIGTYIMAVGSNEAAAYLLGLSPRKIRLILYIMNGFLSSLSGIIMASWLLTARPDAGLGYELRAIAAVVLGGIDLKGGAGSLAATFLAVIFIVLVHIGLQLLNVNPVWQMGVIGCLLVIVAVLKNITQKGERRALWKYFLQARAGLR